MYFWIYSALWASKEGSYAKEKLILNVVLLYWSLQKLFKAYIYINCNVSLLRAFQSQVVLAFYFSSSERQPSYLFIVLT